MFVKAPNNKSCASPLPQKRDSDHSVNKGLRIELFLFKFLPFFLYEDLAKVSPSPAAVPLNYYFIKSANSEEKVSLVPTTLTFLHFLILPDVRVLTVPRLLEQTGYSFITPKLKESPY